MSKKVIFDTDPGVDDATALLFLNARSDVDLVGITTVFGNASIETVTRNALYLVQRFGIAAPVAQGARHGLKREATPPPVFVHGHNGLGDVALAETVTGQIDPRPAWQFIIDTVTAHPGEITLLAVGRLTNLALALEHAPAIAGLVREVVVMGGAFALNGNNGNVTPVAEANMIGDPHAADTVFGASWPLVAVGLDVTRKVIVTPADLAELRKSGSDAGGFVADISQFYMSYHARYGITGFYLHDSSAVAYLVAPDLFTTRSGPVRVVTTGIAEGQTIQRDPSTWYPPSAWDNRPEQCICTQVDADAVKGLMMAALSK